jgi:tetratricopeptide (TPR) repeat protein
MKKQQYLVTLLALVSVVLLAMLPKVVVKNELRDENLTMDTQAGEMKGKGNIAIPEPARSELNSLIATFSREEGEEQKRVVLTDLIEKFKEVNRYDSAAWYASVFAETFPGIENLEKAADLYYEAFSLALDKARIEALGEQARFHLQRALEANPGNLDLKTKIAMTYVSGSNPMQGIMMIREVLAQDPENQYALLNLGLLSMQSGQFDKALERFEQLTTLNPEDSQAKFYLALCHKELGQPQKALEILEALKKTETNREILVTIDRYIREIQVP